MKKVHIVETNADDLTLCGKHTADTTPLNIRIQYCEAVKKSHTCKKCLEVLAEGA